MAQPPTSFTPYAGPALFPRSDADLTSTSQCPACFHVLANVVCTNCRLDLDHPAAAQLAMVSKDAAGLMHERTELIGRIRFETETQARRADTPALTDVDVSHPLSAASVPIPSVPIPSVPTTSVPIPSVPLPSLPSMTAPSVAEQAGPPVSPPGVRAAAESPAPHGPRRSSVQVGLIVVGVSLVSVAAIFFLVYAFINYGIVWRSVIIGAITVAAFVVASLLRRRGLGSTAEGIAAFSVVLVYLDAFAIRANDLFGAGSAEPFAYWGATLVVSSVGFTAWHGLSRLRVGSISASIAFAPGVGLLVAGLAGSLETGTRVFASLLAVGLAGLVHPLVGARGGKRPSLASAERAIAVSVGGAGMVAAFFAAFLVTPANDAGASVALLVLAAAAVAHVAVAARPIEKHNTDPTLLHTVVAFFAVVVAASTTVAVVTFSYRGLSFGGAIFGSTVVSTLLAFGAGYYALRSSPTPVGIALRVAAVGAAAVSALAALVPIGTVLTLDVVAVGDALSSGAWSRDAADPISSGVRDALPAFGALALVLVLVAVFGRLTTRFDRVRHAVVWSGTGLLVAAVPLLTTLATTMIGWFVLAAVSVALLVWSARTGALITYRPVAATVAVTTTVLAFALSWASLDTWLAGTITTILLLLAARFAPAEAAVVGRAAHLAVAVVVTLVGAAAAGRQFGGAFDRPALDTQALWVSVLAVALFALSAIPLRRALSELDRRVLFVLGGIAAVCTAGVSGGTVALSVVFAAALVGWMLTSGTTTNRLERAVAAFALAPALAWLVFTIGSAANWPAEIAQLGPVAAAVLASAVSLSFAALRPGYDLRTASDLGIAALAPVCVAAFLLGPSGLVWLGLLLAAVATLVCAVSPSGLFAVPGPRRYLGWAALALATGALWLRLSESSVTAVEPYVLPLAAALLAIAALDWRARRGAATPLLVLAGLVVGTVPVALSAATDHPVRAAIVGAVAAAILLVGSVARAAAWARPYLDALAVAGLPSVVIVAVGQTAHLAATTPGGTDGRADLWLAAALVVLVASAIGQGSGRPGDRPATPFVAQALAVCGLAVVGIVESVLLDPTPLGFTRSVAVVTLFSAVHVLGQIVRRPPFTRATGWVALGLGVLAAAVSVATGAVDPVEWVSVPIAAALLVSGLIRLRAQTALRSWPALGAGLLVLLVPSLVESQNDGQVWRLVAIGVVSVAVLVVGVARRLQAPFVVGGVVALVHGFATFAPQLLDVYRATEWWVWIGIGGAIIIILGARYERSIATAKNAIASIGGLR